MSAMMTAEAPDEPLHERTPDGRDRHWFNMIDGVWTCECGQVRDRGGKPEPDGIRNRNRRVQ